MSRVRRNQEDEEITVLGTGGIQEMDLPPVTNGNEVVGNALDRAPARAPNAVAPTARQFRVTKPGFITMNGHRTYLREGKVINDLNYPLKELQNQGIRLEKVVEDDAESGVPYVPVS
jgi:hypothetical protein